MSRAGCLYDDAPIERSYYFKDWVDLSVSFCNCSRTGLCCFRVRLWFGTIRYAHTRI